MASSKLAPMATQSSSDVLTLTDDDFDAAKAWLLEAEEAMPEVFKAGALAADGKVMEEVAHFVMRRPGLV